MKKKNESISVKEFVDYIQSLDEELNNSDVMIALFEYMSLVSIFQLPNDEDRLIKLLTYRQRLTLYCDIIDKKFTEELKYLHKFIDLLNIVLPNIE